MDQKREDAFEEVLFIPEFPDPIPCPPSPLSSLSSTLCASTPPPSSSTSSAARSGGADFSTVHLDIADIDEDIESDLGAEEQPPRRSGRPLRVDDDDDDDDDNAPAPGTQEATFHSWSQTTSCMICFHFPLLLLLFMCVVTTDSSKECLKNTKDWAYGEIALLFMMVVVMIRYQHVYSLYINRADNPLEEEDEQTWPPRLLGVYGAMRLIHVVSVFWCLYGFYLMHQGEFYTCEHETSLHVLASFIIISSSTVFFVVLLFCCTSICCVCFFFYCRRRYLLNNPVGLSQETIEDVCKEAVFTTELIPDKNYALCPICLEDYHEEEKLRYLPCRHHFHRECIDRWLLTNPACPVCKQDVLHHERDNAPPPLPSEDNVANEESSGPPPPSSSLSARQDVQSNSHGLHEID